MRTAVRSPALKRVGNGSSLFLRFTPNPAGEHEKTEKTEGLARRKPLLDRSTAWRTCFGCLDRRKPFIVNILRFLCCLLFNPTAVLSFTVAAAIYPPDQPKLPWPSLARV